MPETYVSSVPERRRMTPTSAKFCRTREEDGSRRHSEYIPTSAFEARFRLAPDFAKQVEAGFGLRLRAR